MGTVNQARSTAVHGNLGSYQRIMMDNPKNSLRNRETPISDANPPICHSARTILHGKSATWLARKAHPLTFHPVSHRHV